MKWACVAAVCASAACSDASPPTISDSDGGPQMNEDGAVVEPPCSTPATGCPCEEAGATFSCGVVYRISGTHVDCSPGVITCEADGGWGSCVGASIYDGAL
jgi:hypothetical protein